MDYIYPSLPPTDRLALYSYAALAAITFAALVCLWRRRTAVWPIGVFVASLITCWVVVRSVPWPAEGFEWIYRVCVFNFLLCVCGIAFACYRRFGSQTMPVFVLAMFGLILTGLLQPGISVRPAMRRMQCMSNLHNIILAVQNYASVQDGQLPPAGTLPGDLSWRVEILPLMDQSALYRSYQRDKPWNDPANDEFTKIWIKAYSCPSNPNLKDDKDRYYTAYALLTGPGTAFDGPQTMSLDELGLGPGLSQTMLIGEACGANIVWNEPRDIDVARERPGVNLPGKSRGTSSGWLSTYHTDQANIAFADGSVKSISTTIDPEVLKAMVTASRP